MKLTCAKHPKYKGKREPRADCEACWQIYGNIRDDVSFARLVFADDSVLLISL